MMNLNLPPLPDEVKREITIPIRMRNWCFKQSVVALSKGDKEGFDYWQDQIDNYPIPEVLWRYRCSICSYESDHVH